MLPRFLINMTVWDKNPLCTRFVHHPPLKQFIELLLMFIFHTSLYIFKSIILLQVENVPLGVQF